MSNINERECSNRRLTQLLEDIASLETVEGKNVDEDNIDQEYYQNALVSMGDFLGSEQNELIEHLLDNIQDSKKLKQNWDNIFNNSADIDLTVSKLNKINGDLKVIFQNTLIQSRVTAKIQHLDLKCVGLKKKLYKLDSQLNKEIRKRHRLNLKTKQKSKENCRQDLYDQETLGKIQYIYDSLDKLYDTSNLVTTKIDKFCEESTQYYLNQGYYTLGQLTRLYFQNHIAPISYQIKNFILFDIFWDLCVLLVAVATFFNILNLWIPKFLITNISDLDSIIKSIQDATIASVFIWVIFKIFKIPSQIKRQQNLFKLKFIFRSINNLWFCYFKAKAQEFLIMVRYNKEYEILHTQYGKSDIS